jgi:hypothetical protein
MRLERRDGGHYIKLLDNQRDFGEYKKEWTESIDEEQLPIRKPSAKLPVNGSKSPEMIINVNLAKGKEKIVVHEGDDPTTLTNWFCAKHGITDAKKK